MRDHLFLHLFTADALRRCSCWFLLPKLQKIFREVFIQTRSRQLDVDLHVLRWIWDTVHRLLTGDNDVTNTPHLRHLQWQLRQQRQQSV